MPMHCGCSYHPLHDIMPPPRRDMIDNVREESDHDGETLCPHPGCFPTTKTSFRMFEPKFQQRIIRQQRYLEVIRSHTLNHFDDYDHRLVTDEDVTWLREHDHIANPPAAGCLANWKCSSSGPAAN